MSSETTQDPGAAADEIAVGDTVRFREGRTGTFEPDTQLVVKSLRISAGVVHRRRRADRGLPAG
jgi:hypothetical protein